MMPASSSRLLLVLTDFRATSEAILTNKETMIIIDYIDYIIGD